MYLNKNIHRYIFCVLCLGEARTKIYLQSGFQSSSVVVVFFLMCTRDAFLLFLVENMIDHPC
jgi:hypothetical protein